MKKIPPVTFYTDLPELDDSLKSCFLNEMAACGAEHLVLTSSILGSMLGNHDLIKKYAAQLKSAGLDFVDSHALYGAKWDLNCACEAWRDMLALKHKISLNIAANLGVKSMTFHIGNDFTQPEIPEKVHMERIFSMLDILLPEAEKLDMVIAIENSWTCLASVDKLLEIKAAYPTGHLGLCYDSGHANIMDNGRLYPQGPAYETWQPMQAAVPRWEDKALEKMLKEVAVCHLHDNDGSGDYHNLPGCGNIDWRKTVELLKKAPRLMAIQSEVSAVRHRISCQQLVKTFADLFNDGEEK